MCLYLKLLRVHLKMHKLYNKIEINIIIKSKQEALILFNVWLQMASIEVSLSTTPRRKKPGSAATTPTPPIPTSNTLPTNHPTTNHLTNNHLTNNHLSSNHLINNHLSSNHLTNNHLSSSHITTNHLSSNHLSTNHQANNHLSSNLFRSSKDVAQELEMLRTTLRDKENVIHR